MAGAPNNAYRKAVLFAERERPVSAGEGLIVGLLSSTWVSASVPGVDDRVAVICIVFVTTGEN
jgi:hypothetical protein